MATNPDDTVGSSLDEGVQSRSTPEQGVPLSNAAAKQADEGKLHRIGLSLILSRRGGLGKPGWKYAWPHRCCQGAHSHSRPDALVCRHIASLLWPREVRRSTDEKLVSTGLHVGVSRGLASVPPAAPASVLAKYSARSRLFCIFCQGRGTHIYHIAYSGQAQECRPRA